MGSLAPLLTASAWGDMSWIVWGTLQGGRASFWPGICLVHVGTSGLIWRMCLLGWWMLCRGRRCHFSGVVVFPMCLTLAGPEEIPANSSSLCEKNLFCFHQGIPWNMHACKKPDNGLLRAVLWKPVCLYLAKGKDFSARTCWLVPRKKRISWLGAWLFSLLWWHALPSPGLRYQGGLSAACMCWWSDCWGSTAWGQLQQGFKLREAAGLNTDSLVSL